MNSFFESQIQSNGATYHSGLVLTYLIILDVVYTYLIAQVFFKPNALKKIKYIFCIEGSERDDKMYDLEGIFEELDMEKYGIGLKHYRNICKFIDNDCLHTHLKFDPETHAVLKININRNNKYFATIYLTKTRMSIQINCCHILQYIRKKSYLNSLIEHIQQNYVIELTSSTVNTMSFRYCGSHRINENQINSFCISRFEHANLKVRNYTCDPNMTLINFDLTDGNQASLIIEPDNFTIVVDAPLDKQKSYFKKIGRFVENVF